MRNVQERKSLLLVDDEPNILATLSAILKKRGFEVTTAATISEAMDAIHAHRFDALVCDVKLESGDGGYEVVRAIRQTNPKVVILILTGYPELESAVEGIRERVDDYLTKPADIDELIAVLKDKLAERKPTARILSVSYDEVLLKTRQMLLEMKGYEVVSTAGFAPSLEMCKEGGFDLFILGHSIPSGDKRRLVEAFKGSCPAPIISLRRSVGEEMVDGADYHIQPDPESLLKLVTEIVRGKAAAQQN